MKRDLHNLLQAEKGVSKLKEVFLCLQMTLRRRAGAAITITSSLLCYGHLLSNVALVEP